MKINLRSAGVSGLAAAAVVAGLVVAGAGVANAATIGTLTATPASGSVDTPFSIVSSAPCPEGTDGLSAYINNPAAGWNEVNLVGNNDSEIPNINTSGVPAQDTLGSIASQSGVTLTNGTYKVRLDCRQGLVDVLGSFVSTFDITDGTYAF